MNSKNMWILFIVLCCQFINTIYCNDCITPLNQNGLCVKSCKLLNPLLERIQKRTASPAIINYVRRSLCPINSSSRGICCPLSTKTRSKSPLKCGVNVGSTDRIVGGKNAALGSWPWIAAIYGRLGAGPVSLFCGGTLINDQYVLTAAHCLDEFKILYVALGEHIIGTSPDIGRVKGRTVTAPSEQYIMVENTIVHDQYNNPCRYCYDIALLRLQTKPKFNDYVVPICLPWNFQSNLGFSITQTLGKDALAAGWGRTDTRQHSNILQEAYLRLQELDFCREQKRRFPNPDSMFCAGGFENRDTCSGDSGGPVILTSADGQISYLYGITSYGPNGQCGGDLAQAVYTSVPFYLDWIRDNAGF